MWKYYWADTDGDGVLDKTDNCRSVDNAAQTDTDGNGVGDACNDDRDPDDDEREFGYDNCPTVNNPTQADTDGSGVGDACNNHIDKDGDEWENTLDNCPSTSNADQKNIVKPATPMGDACEIDTDNDGVLEGDDNCPGVANASQADSNKDGIGDACAMDSDGDGVDNQLDNCVNQANPNQLDSNNNGIGNVCELDSDGDGIKDDSGIQMDNCPLISNADQKDSDLNGVGDACEMAFVKPVASGTGDCLSWANACANIQTAIDNADNTGRSQVFLAQGVYKPSATINLKSGIYLVGGFQGIASETKATQANPTLYPTIISGDKDNNDTVVNGIVATVAARSGTNTLRLFNADTLGTTEADKIGISGLVLNAAGSSATDGTALYVKGSYVELMASRVVANLSKGGAVFADAGGKVIVRSTQVDNNKAADGAAVYAKGAGAYAHIRQSQLTSNTATATGGAVALIAGAEVLVEDSLLQGNTAVSGGAAVTKQNNVIFKVVKSRFDGNAASGNGGAVLIEQAATVNIDQTEFSNNAAVNGGAMYASSNSASTAAINITRSLFTENKATTGGGALAVQYGSVAVNVINNTFTLNKAGANSAGQPSGVTTARGGALYAMTFAPINLLFNTFVANDALNTTYGGGAIAINNDATKQVTMLGNLLGGNSASNGDNILVANSGTESGVAKIKNDGYNLIGYNNVSGVVPADAINFASTTSFIGTNATLDEIVETNLTSTEGDRYRGPLATLPIVGGGPARDVVPSSLCSLTTDTRGEKRPDQKSGNACDIGAYEFTVLSCQEDAQRRYEQGELFIKSCNAELEKYELKVGAWNTFGLLMLVFGALIRRQRFLR